MLDPEGDVRDTIGLLEECLATFLPLDADDPDFDPQEDIPLALSDGSAKEALGDLWLALDSLPEEDKTTLSGRTGRTYAPLRYPMVSDETVHAISRAARTLGEWQVTRPHSDTIDLLDQFVEQRCPELPVVARMSALVHMLEKPVDGVLLELRNPIESSEAEVMLDPTQERAYREVANTFVLLWANDRGLERFALGLDEPGAAPDKVVSPRRAVNINDAFGL